MTRGVPADPTPAGRPDWRDMSRAAFDSGAPPGTLFDLEPASVPAPDDGCGTGDLFELIGDDATDMPMPSGRMVE